MINQETTMNKTPSPSELRLSRQKSYIIGFTSSLILSLLAYFLTISGIITQWTLVISLGVLAIVQCTVQLLFFMHLGQDSKPRWRLGIFIFMLLLALVITVGSVWVMHSLNRRMMPTKYEQTMFMNTQTGL